MLVLLVEDDVDISTAIAGLLEVEGYLPTVVDTVELARKAMAERLFEVALLDWMLREETSEALLDDLERAGVPTVFYSANDSARAIASSWGLTFVTKPFDIEQLLAVVEATRTSRRAPRKSS